MQDGHVGTSMEAGKPPRQDQAQAGGFARGRVGADHGIANPVGVRGPGGDADSGGDGPQGGLGPGVREAGGDASSGHWVPRR
eukprot:565932-Pyramimonas_sp.AAC.1